MHHAKKRAAALAVAAALCLTVPVAGAAATALKPVWTGGDEPEPIWDFDAERLTLWDEPAVEPLTMEPGVALYTADEAAAESATADGYTVTIPSTVELTEKDESKTLSISGTVEPYYTLTVKVSSSNGYQLKCGDSEYCIPYELSKENHTITQENNTICTVATEEKRGDFSEALVVKPTTVENATVSGEYTDQLTFNFDAVSKKLEYTVEAYYEMLNEPHQKGNGLNDETTLTHHGPYDRTASMTQKIKLLPGKELTWGLDDLVTYGLVGEADKNYFADDSTYTIHVPNDNENQNGTIKIEVDRKLVWLDLNGELTGDGATANKDLTDPENPNIVWGHADISVGSYSATNVVDNWVAFPMGSSGKMTIKASDDYKITGYYIPGVFYENPTEDGKNCNILFVINGYSNVANTEVKYRSYSIRPVFEKDSTAAGNASQNLTTQPALDNDTPVVLLPGDTTQSAVTTTPDDAKTEKSDSAVSAPDDDIYDTVPAPSADDWYDSDDWTGDDLVPLLDWE